jgi:hypothetical protein
MLAGMSGSAWRTETTAGGLGKGSSQGHFTVAKVGVCMLFGVHEAHCVPERSDVIPRGCRANWVDRAPTSDLRGSSLALDRHEVRASRRLHAQVGEGSTSSIFEAGEENASCVYGPSAGGSREPLRGHRRGAGLSGLRLTNSRPAVADTAVPIFDRVRRRERARERWREAGITPAGFGQGRVACWGRNAEGQTSKLGGTFRQMSAGRAYTRGCAHGRRDDPAHLVVVLVRPTKASEPTSRLHDLFLDERREHLRRPA